MSHIFYTNPFRIFYCNNKKQSPQEVILSHYQWSLISIRLEKHMLLFLSSKKNGWFLFVKDSMPYTLSEKKNRPPLVQDYFSWLSTEFSPLTLKEASKGNLHVELSIKLVHEDIGLTFDWSCWHSSTCLLHISWKQIHNYACRWLPRYRCVRLQEVYILSLDGIMFPPGKGGGVRRG